MKRAVRALAVYLLWNVAVSVVMLLPPPPWSVAGMLFLLWLVLHWTLGSRNDGLSARKRLRVRLRAPAAAVWTPVALAIPLLLVGAAATGTVWGGLVHVPPESANPFLPFLVDPGRRLAIAVYVVGVAPLVEEIVFRGVVQRSLERRLGAAAAIPLAALVFAALHLLPRVLVPLLVMGAALGFVAWATRSLWPAVVMHVANNALAYAALVLWDEESVPTVWEKGPTAEWLWAVAVLAACCAAAVPLGGWLRRAGRPAPVRPG